MFSNARKALLPLIAVLVMLGCTSPKDDDNPVAPDASAFALAVEAHPQAIRADGLSKLVVFVEMQRDGAPVPDSTQVILLTSIGQLKSGVVRTQGGVALDTLTSDTTAASGWLHAWSEGVRDSVEVFFTTVQ